LLGPLNGPPPFCRRVIGGFQPGAAATFYLLVAEPLVFLAELRLDAVLRSHGVERLWFLHSDHLPGAADVDQPIAMHQVIDPRRHQPVSVIAEALFAPLH
jgi:hypothetical protein